ncbi:hypothetical protein [Streptomyces cinerochromogenes]|uniref:hypothetical protein n=1 Tax=Streptomyces cinerochromogenes TaxID=66422 RepID=UPI001670ABD5|nr:hypothetical protein [Streptomyces cinerochromogenes]GGT05042.1 hypothetical protein GCM10010206_79180 [Streptomyces cinerochromogenes]
MSEITTSVVRSGRVVRVAPYVLASTAEERRADLALIERYVIAAGMGLTATVFADAGQPPPIGRRSGWRAARRYAEQGYADGIVAIARPAITTDRAEYEALLEDLFAHRLFLAFLPTEG